MTFSIVSVLDLEDQSRVLLSVINTRPCHHPYWVCSALSPNLEEHWTTRLVECVIDKISLKIDDGIYNL